MSKYNIWGNFKVDIDFEVEAASEEAAKKVAIFMLNDMYSLNCYGAYHNPKTGVDHSFYVDEIGENEEEEKEPDLYYEVVFNGEHCYKYQPLGEKIIIVTHKDKEEAKRIILEKINNKA